jgi:hypothetical protein
MTKVTAYTTSLMVTLLLASMTSAFGQKAGLLGYRTHAYVAFSDPIYTVSAGETPVITVNRTGEYRERSSVDYGTSDGAVRGTLLIPAGVGFVTFSLPAIGETGPKTLELKLSNPGPNVVITRSQAVVTLMPADGNPAPEGEPAPVLALKPNGRGQVAITWPAQVADCVLEKSESAVGGEWTAVATAPQQADGLCTVVEPTSSGKVFYRLRVP